MGRISTPAVASRLLPGGQAPGLKPGFKLGMVQRMQQWLHARRQPLPLAGVDIGPRDLFWVAWQRDAAGQWQVHAHQEPLPDGWGQPHDWRHWDLAVMAQALQQLKGRTQDRQAHHLALGLDATCVQTQSLQAPATQAMQRLLAQADVLMQGQALSWDLAHTPEGVQVLSTPLAAVLTLQALAEAAGLAVGVVEPRELAHARGRQWLAAQSAEDAQALQHHAAAIGLALRRFEPWGAAC